MIVCYTTVVLVNRKVYSAKDFPYAESEYTKASRHIDGFFGRFFLPPFFQTLKNVIFPVPILRRTTDTRHFCCPTTSFSSHISKYFPKGLEYCSFLYSYTWVAFFITGITNGSS